MVLLAISISLHPLFCIDFTRFICFAWDSWDLSLLEDTFIFMLARRSLDVEETVHHKIVNKKVGPMTSNDGVASTSRLASQTASGVLSGSGVLNARPGSTTSSGLLSHMVSNFNADVAREYVEKVADLLLEFARADTAVKSFMCGQSLLVVSFKCSTA